MCGLGQTAANPLLSTIKYFRNEYISHIRYKRCDAAVCREIISSPCQHTCPIDTQASVYIALAAHGRFEEAFDVIRRDNPLPTVCGRVCCHTCETRCRAGEGGGEPIDIRSIKRFIVDRAMKSGLREVQKPERTKEQRIAVVGSGPTGLSCAYYLALEGYDITVFEALPASGGMLRFAIPEYRLPRNILDYDIKAITDAGVKIKTGVRLGPDISIDSLFEDGYSAVFIATGSHKSRKLGIKGEDAQGVIESMEFLKTVNSGGSISVGKRVGVIGGGNAAVDCARAAKRLPESEDVSIIYRRTLTEMPAFDEEIEGAFAEGVKILYLTVPAEVVTSGGRIKAVKCLKAGLGNIDASGRRRPVPIEGSEFIIEIDTLISAISEEPDMSFITGKDGLRISERGTIMADPETLETGREGVFAGGDVVTGPGTVVEAISAGKSGAVSIDRYLKGETIKRVYKVTRPSRYVEPVELTDEEIEKAARPVMPALSGKERAKNFKEVILGFTEDMVIKEARRCLRCDLETEDAKRSLKK